MFKRRNRRACRRRCRPCLLQRESACRPQSSAGRHHCDAAQYRGRGAHVGVPSRVRPGVVQRLLARRAVVRLRVQQGPGGACRRRKGYRQPCADSVAAGVRPRPRLPDILQLRQRLPPDRRRCLPQCHSQRRRLARHTLQSHRRNPAGMAAPRGRLWRPQHHHGHHDEPRDALLCSQAWR